MLSAWIPAIMLAIALLGIYGRIAVRIDRSATADDRLERVEARIEGLASADVELRGRLERNETDVRAILEGRLRVPGVGE